jgi:hypothetical protein
MSGLLALQYSLRRFLNSQLKMPTARRSFVTAVVENKILALGGEKSGYPTGTFVEVEEFDPVTNTWASLPPMPEGRHGMASTKMANGKFFLALDLSTGIHLIGGGTESGLSTSATTWIYYYKS